MEDHHQYLHGGPPSAPPWRTTISTSMEDHHQYLHQYLHGGSPSVPPWKITISAFTGDNIVVNVMLLHQLKFRFYSILHLKWKNEICFFSCSFCCLKFRILLISVGIVVRGVCINACRSSKQETRGALSPASYWISPPNCLCRHNNATTCVDVLDVKKYAIHANAVLGFVIAVHHDLRFLRANLQAKCRCTRYKFGIGDLDELLVDVKATHELPQSLVPETVNGILEIYEVMAEVFLHIDVSLSEKHEDLNVWRRSVGPPNTVISVFVGECVNAVNGESDLCYLLIIYTRYLCTDQSLTYTKLIG
ncbi:hypothetical protein CAPTEDRAFT_207547 [Capitella teleta]|uniref:Uncharacterized protein n=1 Tax=Capitella teleta TaxID=283909 RepID=R7V8J8_CAPTE|nr:hypothetical protein CAPTEDRAFT_207547 [Capitella teleta]|eukprot:ELU14837.1 hypothetical protein CAPTEDRAFT_207547 [Capitella teleta]